MNRSQAVAVKGDYAYVIGYGSNSLAIVSISDKYAPVVVNHVVNLPYMTGPYEISIQDNYVYIVSIWSSSLAIIDITDPLNIPQVVVGHNYTTTQPYYVTTSDQSHVDVSSMTLIKSVDIVSTEPASTSIRGTGFF